MRSKPEETEKQPDDNNRLRQRDVPHLWADKTILRAFRKELDRLTYRKYRNIYLALCEIDSDFAKKGDKGKRQLKGLTKTCSTYAGMDVNTVSKIMQEFRKLKLIDYGRTVNDSNQVTGSYLSILWNSDIMELRGSIRNNSNCSVIRSPLSKDKGKHVSDETTNSSENKTSITSSMKARQSVPKNKKQTTPKKLATSHPLLDHWNSLPNVRHHTNPSSGVYRTAVRRIKQLTSGTMTDMELNDNWAKQQKIPPKYFTRKWPEHLIKHSLTQLSLMATEGYWPEKKDWIRKMNLSDLIYNSRTGKSWFMAVTANGVQTMSEIADQQTAKRHPDERRMVDSLRRALNDARGTGKLQSGEYHQLLDAVSAMRDVREGWKSNGVWGTVSEHFPTLMSQVEDYCEWVRERREGENKLVAKWLGPGSFDWDNYIRFMGESIGINLVKD